MAELYVKYEHGEPVAYAYGEEWVAMALYMDDVGYKTAEEAKAAWEKEEARKACTAMENKFCGSHGGSQNNA